MVKKVSSKKKNDLKLKIYAIVIGLLSGFVNGLFGGGGGMIVVPLLTFLLKRKPKTAHATAILIILPLSILSGIFYAVFGKFSWKIALPTGSGVVLGGLLGALLLSKLKSKLISIIFSVVMLVAGLKMIFF